MEFIKTDNYETLLDGDFLKFLEQKGLTIIEMLIVVLLIGILAGIIFLNIALAGPTSRDGRRQTDIKELESAAEQYFSDKRVFPDQISTLVSNDYLKEAPQDPSNEGDYVYTYLASPSGCDNGDGGDCTNFCAYAKLERDPGSGESFYKDNGGDDFYYLVCSTNSFLQTCIGAGGACCDPHGSCSWSKN